MVGWGRQPVQLGVQSGGHTGASMRKKYFRKALGLLLWVGGLTLVIWLYKQGALRGVVGTHIYHVPLPVLDHEPRSCPHVGKASAG